MKRVRILAALSFVLVAAAAGLPAGAGPAVQGDPQAVAEVTAAFQRFGSVRTWRARISTGRAGVVQIMEFVAPDRFRTQISEGGTTIETFAIGREFWMRAGGTCQKLPAPMPGMANPRDFEPGSGQSTMIVARGGAETIEGVATQTYTMTIEMRGSRVNQKLFVATGTGLPRRIEIPSTEGPPLIIDYYDFDAPITISNPPC